MITVLAALALSMAAPEGPRTYLASIVNLPLRRGESVESFGFSTWGVRFKAVCSVPSGWTIKAGGDATSTGVLTGEGGQGATWFNKRSPASLHKFVLLQLFAPVQGHDIRSTTGVVPATFDGTAVINAESGERKVHLTHQNLRLAAASRCPG
jgi:hypothetical protein